MKKENFNPETTLFTSDTHFGHENIIRFCKRPYVDVEEMNEELIKNWNSVVSKDDTVFHLGDFAFGGSPLWNSVLDQLNGKIHLIIGNHDEKNLRDSVVNRFKSIEYQKQITIDKQPIYLNHYPLLCYGGSYRGVWQLFGHVHSGPGANGLDVSRLDQLFPIQYDVGVDNNLYRPIRFSEVKEIIDRQIDLNKLY